MLLRKCACLGLAVTVLSSAYLITDLAFLKPYKDVILREYGPWILGFQLLLFLNVTLLSLVVLRPLSMTRTGRKLEHMDRALEAGSPVMRDLAERLKQQ